MDNSTIIEQQFASNLIENLEIKEAFESFEKIKQNYINTKDLKDQWAKVASKFVSHKWIYRYINDKQKEALQKHYAIVTEESPYYSYYKRSFKAICTFMGLPYDEVILENMVFKKDKQDKEQWEVAVKYSKGRHKIKLPKGIRLIHVSPVEGIKELMPSFKSKVKGKYMYPSKRVFFSIAKEIRPTQAGLEGKKTSRYTPISDINEVYIDPTYNTFRDGCVYIETEQPIPVESFEKKMFDLFGLIKSVTNKSESSIESLDELSLFDIGGSAEWRTHNQDHSIKKFKSSSISDEDYIKLKELIRIMKTEEDYKEYKKAFDKFCYYCHILSRGVILTKYELKKTKKDDENTLYVEYTYNTKRITLPDDCVLYHMTKVAGIKQLIPTFRGKSVKGYLYDKPRVYFTIKKHAPKLIADYNLKDKTYTYVCNSKLKNVFVDPLIWGASQGAVYVETNKPIDVVELTKNNADKYIQQDNTKNESVIIDESINFDEFYNFVSRYNLEP